MHPVVAALTAADEIDPATVRPSPLASVVFVFLLLAVVLLLWSFVRHLRRAQANLGPARATPPGEIRPGGTGAAGGPADTGPGEGDIR